MSFTNVSVTETSAPVVYTVKKKIKYLRLGGSTYQKP